MVFYKKIKDVETLKILVLGNGFDLDHKLPTSYYNFLNFCNCVLCFDNYDTCPYYEKLTDTQKDYLEKLKHNNNLLKLFSTLLEKNNLLYYFNNHLHHSGTNWIDLEREIKNIVNQFKLFELDFIKSNKSNYKIDTNHRINKLLNDLNLHSLIDKTWDDITLNAVHASLCSYLENFCLSLELYISTFINHTEISGISPDIVDFDADNVLIFNYSTTYERVYGGTRWKENINHIHGMAEDGNENKSNIVLGITSANDSEKEPLYVEFEKYFQRITKHTGSEYKNWLDKKMQRKEKIEVAFFGHSLDPSDSDIIKDLLCNDKTTITIYFYNEKSYQQIIANLIEILGKEYLLSNISGYNPKITFIKQREHQLGNNAGINITRDTKKLYRLYILSNEEITNLITKITEKIREKDLSYFYSQEKTISLFEALKHSKIDNTNYKDFVEICVQLDYVINKSGQPKKFDPKRWSDITPWEEEIPCNTETLKLINAVNKSNQKRFDENANNTPYHNITEMKTAVEMTNALIDILNEEKPSKLYWKNLSDLAYKMVNNKKFEMALKSCSKIPLSIFEKSKLQHLNSIYENACYDAYMSEQIEQEFNK